MRMPYLRIAEESFARCANVAAIISRRSFAWDIPVYARPVQRPSDPYRREKVSL